jgi:hypothetical protein
MVFEERRSELKIDLCSCSKHFVLLNSTELTVCELLDVFGDLLLTEPEVCVSFCAGFVYI